MTTPRLAFLSFTGGACFGLGIMGAYTARTFYAIHRGHRWGDVRRFFDIKEH